MRRRFIPFPRKKISVGRWVVATLIVGASLGFRNEGLPYVCSAIIQFSRFDGPREVALSPRAAALLRSLPVNEDGRFFTFSPTSASCAWRRAVTRAHDCYLDECQCFGRTVDLRYLVDANMHDLRHTRLTELGRAGLSTVELMAVSGHVTLSQLARYVHVQSAHIVSKLAAIEEQQQAETAHAAGVVATSEATAL